MGRHPDISVRERLLEAGVAVISKSGFNGCSVQDITEAAGVPKGSFYNHFESKEALGAAALAHFWEDGACPTLDILSDMSRPPLERLRAYFEEFAADLAVSGFAGGCLIGNLTAELSDHSPMIAAELSAIFAGWTRSVAACLRAAQDSGTLCDDVNADSLATFVLNAWEGAVLRARIEKGERPLRQFIDILFSQLLRC